MASEMAAPGEDELNLKRGHHEFLPMENDMPDEGEYPHHNPDLSGDDGEHLHLHHHPHHLDHHLHLSSHHQHQHAAPFEEDVTDAHQHERMHESVGVGLSDHHLLQHHHHAHNRHPHGRRVEDDGEEHGMREDGDVKFPSCHPPQHQDVVVMLTSEELSSSCSGSCSGGVQQSGAPSSSSPSSPSAQSSSTAAPGSNSGNEHHPAWSSAPFAAGTSGSFELPNGEGYITETVAGALANYPHMRSAGGMLYLSGVSSRRVDGTHEGVTLDPVTGEVLDKDIKEQTRACIRKMQSTLALANASLANLVDLQVFLIDMKDYRGMNEAYNEYFDAESGPSRTCIAVHQLPHPNLLIEIKGIALDPNCLLAPPPPAPQQEHQSEN